MKDLTALVTGASSGIGRMFARELAKKGYKVTCVARRGDRLASLIDSLGAGHRAIVADLACEEQLDAVSVDVERSRYSLLVNNAGFGIYGRFDDVPLEKLNDLVRLNVVALMHLAHAFLRDASSGDALINVSSVLSLLPYPGSAVYSGTKAFVTSFSEALWYEYREKGVYVMALLPGVTDTEFHQIAYGSQRGPEGLGPVCRPEAVVREAIDTLTARKKPSLVSGGRYRMLTTLATRLLSRAAVATLMGRSSPTMKQRPPIGEP